MASFSSLLPPTSRINFINLQKSLAQCSPYCCYYTCKSKPTSLAAPTAHSLRVGWFFSFCFDSFCVPIYVRFWLIFLWNLDSICVFFKWMEKFGRKLLILWIRCVVVVISFYSGFCYVCKCMCCWLCEHCLQVLDFLLRSRERKMTFCTHRLFGSWLDQLPLPRASGLPSCVNLDHFFYIIFLPEYVSIIFGVELLIWRL